jgi:uncharacterized protein
MDLTLILTEDCNLRCAYCYQKQFAPTAMPVELAVEAVRRAFDHAPAGLALTFFGGEPLLRAGELLHVLEAARALEAERGVPLTAKVPTNGLLLDEAFVERAGQLGLFISLSLDGIQPAQDAGRISLDGGGSFAQAERALRLLLRSGKPFGVYSVITPQNVRHLAASRRYLWGLGARILVSAIDYTAEWDDAALRALSEQYAALGQLYEQMLKEKAYFHLEPFDSRISLRTRSREYANCCPGLKQVTVGPDGTLYGCVEYFYRRLMPLGTVATWLDEEAVRALARSRSGRAPECGECGVRDRCTHTCDCVNLRTAGLANRPTRSLCLTEQTTIRAADRVAAELYRKRSPGFVVKHYSESYSMLAAMERLLDDLEATHERAEAGP